ncbi:MAG: RHS repeat-associated core domain-containing protein, partial [Flammeovirgaceae bacterium]
NESMMDVFFDELRVKHERLVWQENSYYPFGMSIKPLDKEGEPNHRFTYNGKELEETTNLLEYGQRDYDPQLGRFHKVDRFAESYHTFTPYHYGLNNPIMNIDVNGDYVRIFSSDGNASYIYQNGKLHHYTQDSEGNVTVGEEYKGDGNGKYHDSFVQQAFDDLNKINSVDEGQTVINELTSSSAVYNIKYIDHIVKDMGYDQLYADGSIPEHYQNLGLLNSRYNPELKTLYVGSGTATGHFDVNFNSLFVTGHELFHAYQDEIGSLERLSISKNSQGVRLREVQAVGFESYLRAKLNIQGYGVRTDYSAEFDSGSVPAQLNEYNHKEFVWDWLNSGYKYTPWSASDFIQNKAVWKDLYKRLKK